MSGTATFASIAARATASGAGGKKKLFKDMTDAEKKEFVNSKRKELAKAAKTAHEVEGAMQTRGKRPVKMWEADVKKLVKEVDNGKLVVKYNHGTEATPDVHPECYITPLAHISKANMLAGAGNRYESKTKTPDQKPPSPKDWCHMCAINIGLPYPKDVIEANPSCVEEQRRSLDFLRAREAFILDCCVNDTSIYTSLRDDEATAVQEAKDMSDGKLSDEKIVQAKRNFWRKQVKRQCEIIKDDDGKELFWELGQKSGSFFLQRDGKKEEVPKEVTDVLATSTDERKLQQARVIKEAYDEGYMFSRVPVDDIDGKLIECSIFHSPIHDGAVVVASISITWYQDGINRGCSMHPARIRRIQDTEFGRNRIDLGTQVYAQHLKERTRHEIAVLHQIKACTDADGLDLVTLMLNIGADFPTEQLTDAISSLTKDGMIKQGKTISHMLLTNPALNIAALPQATEEVDDKAVFAKVVAEAKAKVEAKLAEEAKKKAEAEEAEKKKKAEEQEAEKKKKAAAEEAAKVTATLAPQTGAKRSLAAGGVADSMIAAHSEDDDDALFPRVPTPDAQPQKRHKKNTN